MEGVPSPTVRDMASQKLEQKVRQLDNDVHEIYGMLSDIREAQKGHDARLDAHDARFDALDARFDAHDARFDSVEGKLDRVLEILER